MNVRLTPPCWVTLDGKPLRLRRLSYANREMLAKGWRGLVAHVQNERGTGLVEYRKLRAAGPSNNQAEERR